MASFITELKRRNVFKVAVAYAIVAWIVMQVADVITQNLGLPSWFPQIVTALLILGLPIAMVFAWAFELTPEGIKPSKSVESIDSITHATGRKLDFIIIGVLVLAVVFLVIDNYLLNDELEVVAEKTSTQLNLEESAETASLVVIEERRDVLSNSVAVLPFENLSPDPDNAYFANGIHDTILQELGNIQDMNVISRTAMLRYADRSTPIPQVAEELNVQTVMEGSVQYAGGRVLVTVLLIDPQTNTHLWGESYDRPFSDIFTIQADIATQIAMALEAQLLPTERESLEKPLTNSLEAYALYLKARAMLVDLEPIPNPEFYQYLDQAIALDPEFALAHAVKASVYGISKRSGVQLNELNFEEMEQVALEHIERALAIDPDLGLIYMALAEIHTSNRHGTLAKQAFERAVQLSPNDVDILDNYARFLSFIGAHEESVRLTRRTVELAPNDFHNLLGQVLLFAGDLVAAADSLRQAIELSPSDYRSHLRLVVSEILLGNETEALAVLRHTEQLNPNNAFLAYYYSRLGLQEDAVKIFNRFEAEIADGRSISRGIRAVLYLAIGEADKAYDNFNQISNEDMYILQIILLNILNDSVLEEPRFVEIRNKLEIIL